MKPGVRKATLEYHFKFHDTDAHRAITIQDVALHFEMAHPMLENRIANPWQRPLALLLCDLNRCHLLQLGQIPASLRIAFRRLERNMNKELDPLLFRIRAPEAATDPVDL